MTRKLISFRVDDDKARALKIYAINHDVTVQDLLEAQIDILLQEDDQ